MTAPPEILDVARTVEVWEAGTGAGAGVAVITAAEVAVAALPAGMSINAVTSGVPTITGGATGVAVVVGTVVGVIGICAGAEFWFASGVDIA